MQTHAALRSEEASEAAWSGGKGAVVGAARVAIPFQPGAEELLTTPVGNVRCHPGRSRLFYVSGISWLDNSIQSVSTSRHRMHGRC